MHTNIYDHIYVHIDVHRRDEVRPAFPTNYPENLKYAMCICYTLEEVLLCSIVTVPIPGTYHDLTLKSQMKLLLCVHQGLERQKINK